ncbi:MAG: YigZ family protein [Bacteroidetes bacterium GWF2_41_61]|nr:MAG: YigZ family protein [Bacteroidetes bacterium GWE2_40_15]OFY27630.1 MAG: YigZ family protein [Bacteroidetes bacterium GWF2_41_61]OFY90246.1 MAG: YigZ family protein [Bacteroidetes bacterium RIFOXYA12_FULL_40_10]HBG25122.1 YigZ family protein [Rikenellaceae bacterium]HBZ24789.1 YigZ family protein [Rikenellaceae bacterium]
MGEIKASDSYKTLAKSSTGIYKELGSKFLSFAFPVSSQEEIKTILSNIKKDYFDARHHCYAYRLGLGGDLWRANDDGEPSSTAGKPILGQLLSHDLSDTLIVVVRYFGGTKLGVPGLIRAYRGAAADAINNSEVVEKIAVKNLILRFSYASIEPVMKLIKSFSADIKKQELDSDCLMVLNIRVSEYTLFLDSLKGIEGLSIENNT